MKRTILLVEDDQTIRESLSDFLEIEGYRVHRAAHGVQGLEILRTLKEPCIILLDLQMPVMSGEQMLEALQLERSPSFDRAKVLILTARGETFAHQRISGLIRKPLDLDDLLAKIESVPL